MSDGLFDDVPLMNKERDNPDLDAICQDLQEMTYTQAMRIAELEAKLSEAEKQEPYGWVSQHTTKGMYEWQFNKELSGVYKDTAISILPVYTYLQPKQDISELDAICQDLQEKTYTQAMRIAELEAKLKEKNNG